MVVTCSPSYLFSWIARGNEPATERPYRLKYEVQLIIRELILLHAFAAIICALEYEYLKGRVNFWNVLHRPTSNVLDTTAADSLQTLYEGIEFLFRDLATERRSRISLSKDHRRGFTSLMLSADLETHLYI